MDCEAIQLDCIILLCVLLSVKIHSISIMHHLISIKHWFTNWATRLPRGTQEVSRGYMELLQNQNKTIIDIMLCGHHLHSSERANKAHSAGQ